MVHPKDILNIVVVGDGTVGKTCLLHAYTDKDFTNFYQPTIYDRESIQTHLDGQDYTVQLHDTAGQEDYEKIRKQFYNRADCFILCYSIDNCASFDNILSKWIPELRSDKIIPIVLVGTKVDLRKEIPSEVSTAQGDKLKSKINANAFIECSAKVSVNVDLVFQEAIRACVLGVPAQEEEDNCCGCTIA